MGGSHTEPHVISKRSDNVQYTPHSSVSTMSQHLSEEERWSIIIAWQKCDSMACVARETSYSYKRVKYWVDHYKKHGNVTTRKPSGRPRLISTAAARAAVELLADSDNYGTAQVVAAELHQRGLTPGNKPVHKTTLIRAAVAQATTDGDPLEVASGEPEKELTAATKQKRMEFCQANLSTNWAQIMFTDRKKFAFRYPGTKHRGSRRARVARRGRDASSLTIPRG